MLELCVNPLCHTLPRSVFEDVFPDSHCFFAFCVWQITPLKESSPEPETAVIQVSVWTSVWGAWILPDSMFRMIKVLNSSVIEWEKGDSAPTEPEPKNPKPSGGGRVASSTPGRVESPSLKEPVWYRQTATFKWRPEEVGCSRTACLSCDSANLRGHQCRSGLFCVSGKQTNIWRRPEEMGGRSSACPLCRPTNSRADVHHNHRWVPFSLTEDTHTFPEEQHRTRPFPLPLYHFRANSRWSDTDGWATWRRPQEGVGGESRLSGAKSASGGRASASHPAAGECHYLWGGLF